MATRNSFSSTNEVRSVSRTGTRVNEESNSPKSNPKGMSDRTQNFIEAIKKAARESGVAPAPSPRPPASANPSPPTINLAELQARARADLRRHMYPNKSPPQVKLPTDPILIGELIPVDPPVMHLQTPVVRPPPFATRDVLCEACYAPNANAKLAPCEHAVCKTCLSFSLINVSVHRKVSRCMACGTRVDSFNTIKSR